MSFGAELALWAAPTAGFLAFYLQRHAGPLEAIAPHLQFVATLFLAGLWIRFAAWRWLADEAASALGAVVSGGSLGLLLLYDLSNWVALESWGRIISGALLRTYAAQSGDLLDALGIPPLWVAIPALILPAVLLLGVYAHLRRHDWIRGLATHGRPGFVAGMLALAAAAIGLSGWHFLAFTPASSGEPIVLTLRPTEGLRTLGSHANLSAKRLDMEEQAAREAYHPRQPSRRPNIVVVVVDALRADRLGVNGYARATTPTLDRLVNSGDAVSVGHAYAACAESACGLMAIAASRHPHRLPPRPITLQEVLRLHGYATHMIMSGDHTNFYGLRDAYGSVDSYYDGSMSSRYMNDDRLVVDRLRALGSFGGTPTFIQFHLMSAHPLSRRSEQDAPFRPYRSYVLDGLTGRAGRSEATRELRYDNYYDNGVVQADAIIDQLVGVLRDGGYLNDALLVVTADHGEMLGEHGRFGHARTVQESVVRIPLVLMRFGGRSDGRLQVRPVASQVDIGPTLLKESGIEAPATWSGSPLQIQAEPYRPAALLLQQGPAYGLIDPRSPGHLWKYQADASSGLEQVHELISDAGEQRNLVDEVPAQTLRDWRTQLREVALYGREQPGPPQ